MSRRRKRRKPLPVKEPVNRYVKVRAKSYRYDFSRLADDTWNRMAVIYFAKDRKRCFFINPEYTITCEEPTWDFFDKARWAQAKWRRRLRLSLGRDFGKTFSEYRREVNTDEHKTFQYFTYCLTVNGLLWIDDDLYDGHRWPDRGKKRPERE